VLRIQVLPNPEGKTIVVEGAVAGQSLDELRRVAVGAGVPLSLDLWAVRYVDQEGEALLRELLASGAKLARCSPYVRAILEGAAP
jgi:hypothetical protein